MLEHACTRAFAAFLLGAVMAAQAAAHEHHHDAATHAAAACEGNGLNCATTATPAFAADGTLWLTWAAHDKVWVARSADLGRTFDAPRPISPPAPALPLDNGPDARPRIVAARDGSLVVSFATRDPVYNGHAFTARSEDGRTFSQPREIAPGSPSQRFETLAADADGRIFAAWVDKSHAAAAKKAGQKYAGAALAFSWSDGTGTAFAPATIARDNTCECCRIGLAFLAPGRPAVMFRNIFEGGVRDHAVIVFDNPSSPGPVRRVSVDDWQTDACPHHGPSLAVSPAGTLHATWFTNGKAQKGLYYAFSHDQGITFSPARRLGSAGKQNSRPFVLAVDGAAWLVWKEFDGEKTQVMSQFSRDDGETWSPPHAIAETGDASDHPLLLSHGAKVYLSWLTKQEGYRVVELSGGS